MKIHILTGSGNNVYQVVIHASTPAGNNAAGVSWATALANSGNASTMMTEGNGPGQISTQEKNSVLNGSIMEASFQWEDNPEWTNQQRIDDINLRATQLVAEMQARYAAQLRYFGHTAN